MQVDDIFHDMDESERWTFGSYVTLDEAIAACKALVEQCLTEAHQPGMTAAALYSQYTSFGDDPFILGPGGGVKFSAWDYAKARCTQICASG